MRFYAKTISLNRQFNTPPSTRHFGTGTGSAGEPLARIALGVCIVAGLATVVYAAVGYEAMHDSLPTSSSQSGYTTNYGNWKAVALLVAYPLLILGLIAFLLIGSLGWI
jgi:hypothetical protein